MFEHNETTDDLSDTYIIMHFHSVAIKKKALHVSVPYENLALILAHDPIYVRWTSGTKLHHIHIYTRRHR